MMVETLTEMFSHICGQSRSFHIDGVPLPVDQRCLGLYVGAFLTALWLTGTGVWRRGLPGRGIVILHVALLVLAILGGRHVIDPGALWRFMLGLWTGHVVLLWLAGAAAELSHVSSPGGNVEPVWTARHTAQGVAFPILLAALAWALPAGLHLGWAFWSAAAILGVIALAVGLGLAAVALGRVGFRMIHAA